MAISKQRRARLEPMTTVDTAWLRMERPSNLMMISGVLMLDRAVDLQQLRATVSERFLAYRRFRQKALQLPDGAFWETDHHFEIEKHVVAVSLPGKAGQRELQDLVSQLASTALDQGKPLWQFHLVERYDGGSALIMRIHHCYADGIALVQVLLSLTDFEAHPPTVEGVSKQRRGRVFDRLHAPVRSGIEKVLHAGEQVVEKGIDLLRHPETAAKLAREGLEIVRELAIALTLSDDPATPYRGVLSETKRVAWAEPLKLDEVKAISRALNCTVNDVLLAAVSGALRAYLVGRGHDIDGITIRAMVPVNLRPLEHARELGNHFGLVFLELPIGESNPLRRLERVASCMADLKRSRQAIVAFGLLAVLGMGPASVQEPALEMFSRKATAVATNVPGPAQPLYLAGARVRDMMFWVPQNGSIGLGISILSYNGQVHFGLICDAQLVAEPDQVIGRFAAEFEKLLLITLMEDWQGDINAAGAAAIVERFCALPQVRKMKKRRGPTSVAVGAQAERVVAGAAPSAEANPPTAVQPRSRSRPRSVEVASDSAAGFGAALKDFRRRRGVG